MKPSLSIIGLGKLGLPIFAAFASKGFKIIGIDIDTELLACLSENRYSTVEPKVDELLKKYRANWSVASRIADGIENSEVTFVLIPTPSEISGSFSVKFILGACREIGQSIREKSTSHLMVILSTIMPGSMQRIKRELESSSGKKCGEDFGLCYSPELVAIGSIVKNFLNPDFAVIGESDPRAGAKLEGIFKEAYENNPPIIRMNFINAELSKVTLNAYLTTKISFANTLAEICEKIPGANVDEVTSAIGRDSRIGTKFLKGALGYAGFCFPRDSKAFIHLAKKVGISAPIAEATDEVNERQAKRIVALVKASLSPNGEVGVLGIAFKPGTRTMEESQGLKIALGLKKAGISVTIYDPLGWEKSKELPGGLLLAGSLEACIRKADVTVIANPCKEFKTLGPQDFKPGSTVIDCWRMLDYTQFAAQWQVGYLRVGVLVV